MSRLTVAHVFPFAGVAGTEIGTRRVMEAAAGFGVRNVALLLNDIPALRDFTAGTPTLVASSVPDPSLRRAARFLLDSRALARMLRSSGVGLVHAADILGAYHVGFACRLARIPLLSHVRNRYPELPRRERFFINQAQHFAFVSRHTRKAFALRVPDHRATVLYDGIEAASETTLAGAPSVARDVRAELGLPPDALIASMFARVAPQKDYETLIRAAAVLAPAHPRLVFVIVGDGSSLPEFRRHGAQVNALLRSTGLAARFIFTGFRLDAPRFMLASDLCVLSTHWEGLPLVLLEAMACARPVVATAVDGVPETIEDGVTGFLVPHADPGTLAEKLSTLLLNPTLRCRMGEAAREHVRQRFSREQFAHNVEALYRKLQIRGNRPVGY